MKRKILRRRWHKKETTMGFQVAPMIDVVFVILLFFMVAAGHAKKETGLDSELPGEFRKDHQVAVELPDEIEIAIDEAGGIQLNEELLDEAGSKELPQLIREIRALKSVAGNDFDNVSILLKPDDRVNYQRIVDVLDVLAKEKITKVSFQAASDE